MPKHNPHNFYKNVMQSSDNSKYTNDCIPVTFRKILKSRNGKILVYSFLELFTIIQKVPF